MGTNGSQGKIYKEKMDMFGQIFGHTGRQERLGILSVAKKCELSFL